MKIYSFFVSSMLVCVLGCVSCQEEVIKDAAESYPYTFSGFEVSYGSIDELTRGIEAESFSLLAVDVVDDEYVQSVSRLSDPSALSSVTLDLTLGAHKIYFVCAAKPWNSFDEAALMVHWNKQNELGETWGAVIDLQVEGAAQEPVDVSLKRIVTYARTQMNDVLPASLSKVGLDLMGGSWSYNLLQQSGGTPSAVSRVISVPSSYIGQQQVIFGIYSFVPEGVTQSPLFTVTAYDATDQVIASHSFENVQMKANQFVLYQGQFFTPQSSSNAFQFYLDDQWMEKFENY